MWQQLFFVESVLAHRSILQEGNSSLRSIERRTNFHARAKGMGPLMSSTTTNSTAPAPYASPAAAAPYPRAPGEFLPNAIKWWHAAAAVLR
jgi:hypothetical protein